MVERVPEELWMEVYNIVQEVVIKAIPKKKTFRKAKWLSKEALQTAKKRKCVKGKRERERYTQMNAAFQGRARRDKKHFLIEKCKKKKIEENNRMGRLEISSRKLETPREHFMQRQAQ